MSLRVEFEGETCWEDINVAVLIETWINSILDEKENKS